MDFTTIKMFFENCGLPIELLITCILIIIFTQKTKEICKHIEIYFEEKKGKEIKIFNHTKIIFLLIWSCIGNVVLCVSAITLWQKFALNLFVTVGLCSMCYELVVKKVEKWLEV